MRWRSSRTRRRARCGLLVVVGKEKVRVFDPVAGGEALLVIDGGGQLAVFTDPATGAPRLACASGEKVLVFDPVAGGDALLVLDIGSGVDALAVFKEPATGAPRLACGSGRWEGARLRRGFWRRRAARARRWRLSECAGRI